MVNVFIPLCTNRPAGVVGNVIALSVQGVAQVATDHAAGRFNLSASRIAAYLSACRGCARDGTKDGASLGLRVAAKGPVSTNDHLGAKREMFSITEVCDGADLSLFSSSFQTPFFYLINNDIQ